MRVTRIVHLCFPLPEEFHYQLCRGDASHASDPLSGVFGYLTSAIEARMGSDDGITPIVFLKRFACF